MQSGGLGTHCRRRFDSDHVVAEASEPSRITASARSDVEHQSWDGGQQAVKALRRLGLVAADHLSGMALIPIDRIGLWHGARLPAANLGAY
jgi:hypothetical protein